MKEIVTEDNYFACLESIQARIKEDTTEDERKWIGDKLNNSWVPDGTINEWIDSAGIKEYLS